MIKKTVASLTLLLFAVSTFSQTVTTTRTIPAIDIKDMDGKTVNTSTLSNDGKPFVLDFWATWCKPCVNELNAINEVYADWQKETGVKIFAISVDDARTVSNVKPFVNGKGWEYDVYVDTNGDLKRALNIGMVPYTFLVNGKGEIVNVHTGYAPGDENKLYEEITKLLAETGK